MAPNFCPITQLVEISEILNNILYRKHKISIQHFSSVWDLRDEVPEMLTFFYACMLSVRGQ